MLRSFPRGSAGGPDGIRPQHLLDLTSASAERGGHLLISALTSFVSHVANGNTPESVRPYVFGATLIPLAKKDGGIRPIAVGQTLRRVVAKCMRGRVMHSVGGDLAPLQLGCGVPLGCEAAAHATRQFLHHMPPDHVIAKVDFKNAFNSLRRDSMIRAVQQFTPDLFSYVHSAYASPSLLFCGDQTILSEEGVQQGDPLGPLLFSITIQNLISGLRSPFRVFYLDDGTIGGSPGDVVSDLHHIEEGAAGLGLVLNRNKSELICDDGLLPSAVFSSFPGLQVVGRSCASLLGTPIGDLQSIERCLRDKLEKLGVLGDRLHLLSSHDALLILRHSLCIPKVLYILRTAPCFLSNFLSTFDNRLRSLLSGVLNVDLSNDRAWIQATLPVKAGGIGVRRVSQLAPSAYLASAAGCSDLTQLIQPPLFQDLPVPYWAEAVECWKRGVSADPPCPSRQSCQRAWDSLLVTTSYETLLESAISSIEKARLMAVVHPDSGAWLNALPISALGLRLDDTEIQISIGLRLGLPLCRPHLCDGCGATVDESGVHGLSCRFSKGRHSRHASLNSLVKRGLDSAKIPSHLEPVGLFRLDGRRPDGATMVPWKCGKVMVWDVTCADSLANSHRELASRETGAVAACAEQRKRAKYTHLEATHFFIPIAFETFGAIGEEGRSFFKDLGRRIAVTTKEPQSLQFLLQRLSIAVQRGNAASILGTLGSMERWGVVEGLEW